jgi:hypothetical protein
VGPSVQRGRMGTFHLTNIRRRNAIKPRFQVVDEYDSMNIDVGPITLI